MTNKKLLIIGGAAVVGLFLFSRIRAAQTTPDNVKRPLQYSPSWGDTKSSFAPQWGIGIDGKPAKIFNT